MNLLSTNNQPLTMSSREIAELTGKQHSHVKRDIDNMCAEINHPELEGSTFEHRGNWYTQYHLNKELTLCLVAGYSAKLRMAIIRKWQQLEESAKPKLPQTFAEALQLAADQARQLELQAPKVAFVDNLVDKTNLLTATQVGQKHKLSAIKLNKILAELNVYNGNVKRGKVFKQWFVDKGYGEMKKTELGYDQPLFTNAGEIWINEQLHSEGIV